MLAALAAPDDVLAVRRFFRIGVITVSEDPEWVWDSGQAARGCRDLKTK